MRGLSQAGYAKLPLDDLVRFRIHKVTAEFVRALDARGYKFRIHNVDAKFVRDARADGCSIFSPGDAVDLAIHGPRWKRRG